MNKGTWFGGDFLSIFVLPNGENTNQIGLAIGKKVGKAFKRNRVKRLIKESYTKIENDIKYGYYIVFVWKSKAEYDNVTFDAIDKDIVKVFKKAGLLQ